ncbi:glutathione S-transferase family protein [Fluoribacter dumoffii]|nr:glutathione S-transferase family protein [Fluoribacter dumoffii]MCW8416707.1 glutathione S-transferase family protein [Fluoribacter dumoffii]MCW8455453.1 glutathione S-transferase family protein [Fluoribacter dumoffii]MCW8460469.1 glutathione S-transferase family protein [Fluoribacter dumoffii]MCW8483949.1 glutathione S-transferase family protein [Fluoribacter dumoffii]
MIILYSYPELFGLPDNNPFGLKVDTFLRLTHINYQQEHIVNIQNAPRGQLPYLDDAGQIITDSNNMLHYLQQKYVNIDLKLTEKQRNLHFLITRMLDNHLYWVMSYSRWQDDQFWPLFKAEFLKQLPELSETSLEQIRKYNIEKYHYQGIGRYFPKDIYQSGIDDLQAILHILEDKEFIFGSSIHTLDACCYGFLANIVYLNIETPLKEFILDTPLKNYTHRIRALLNY